MSLMGFAARSYLIIKAGAGRATLDFAVAGGRTRLLRQHVAYPFHVTLPFYLDPPRPDLATLYLQSVSGGLYSGERVDLSISTGEAASAAITTQSATIVHDCQGQAARQSVRLTLARASLLIYAPDPLVLFPGAALQTELHVTLAPGSVALCQDGFACHDPAGQSRGFHTLGFTTVVHGSDGRRAMTDRGFIPGDTLGTAASPLGPYRASGGLLLLGSVLADARSLQGALDETACLSGISALPNGIGTGIRLLAMDGGALTRGLLAAFSACFQAITGVAPATRRK